MLGGFLFVAAGFWMFWMAERQHEYLPMHMKIAGASSIIFFGACVLYAITKLYDDKPGLIIDSRGITDNSSGVAAGLVTWESITYIEENVIKGQKFIAVGVENPKRLIERQSGLKRIFMNMNYKYYKTPIHISAISLKIEYDKLRALLKDNLEKYGRA
jgi:hypothetical protein